MKYRRLATIADPPIRFNVPLEVKKALKERGLKNSRRLASEILNRLVDLLENDDELQQLEVYEGL